MGLLTDLIEDEAASGADCAACIMHLPWALDQRVLRL